MNGFKWLIFASQLGEAHFSLFFFQGTSCPINSGDNVALRSAFTRGQWQKCTRASCVWINCRCSDIADLTGSAFCPKRMNLTLQPRTEGAINSGDIVSLRSCSIGINRFNHNRFGLIWLALLSGTLFQPFLVEAR